TVSPAASARMPASLASAARRSFGHLSPVLTPVTCVTAVATDTPASSGSQHRALRLPGQGPGQQVGVGRAGALDDLEVAPQAAGPDQGAAQGRPVQGRADLRMVLGSHANPLLFRKPGEGKSVTGLGTSQRRGADDDDAPSASASRGQQAGVAAPEREFRLWPPQVTFDAGPLAARARGVGASLTPAALWRNHRLFTIAACVSVIPRVIAALGFKPAL